MEIDKTVQELLQKPKDQHDQGALDVIHARRKQLADIFFDKSKSPQDRNKVFDELCAIHKYLGMGDIFKAKVPKAFGGAAKPIRTPQQRKEDAVIMMVDLWKEAKAFALKEFPVEKTAEPAIEGVRIVDKHTEDRSILAQVFFKGLVESYKQ